MAVIKDGQHGGNPGLGNSLATEEITGRLCGLGVGMKRQREEETQRVVFGW